LKRPEEVSDLLSTSAAAAALVARFSSLLAFLAAVFAFLATLPAAALTVSARLEAFCAALEAFLAACRRFSVGFCRARLCGGLAICAIITRAGFLRLEYRTVGRICGRGRGLGNTNGCYGKKSGCKKVGHFHFIYLLKEGNCLT
jgi:hypothetical protein